MDPTETLKSILAALRDGDSDEAAEHAQHLADWLSRGGVVPSIGVRDRKLVLRVFCSAVTRDEYLVLRNNYPLD